MTGGVKEYILTQTTHIFGLAVIIFQAVPFLLSLAPGYGSKELLTLPEKPLYPPPKGCQLSFFSCTENWNCPAFHSSGDGVDMGRYCER